MRKLLLLALLMFSWRVNAQTNCAGLSTCNLSSTDLASAAAFRNALSTVNQDPATVTVPAGSFTWADTSPTGTPLSLTRSLVIQGAGAQSSTTSGASVTGTDLTTITDHTGTANSPINFATTAGKSLRITGIFFNASGATVPKTDGIIKTSGSSTSIRLDHCHFFLTSISGIGLFVGGRELGVADHDFMDNANNIVSNDFVFHEEQWLGESTFQGDGSWNDTDHWGSSQFFFVEDTRFHNGGMGDGSWGGRYVIRYSTCVADSTSSTADCQMYNHGLTPGRQRSNRAVEMYGNTFTQPGSPGVNHPPESINGGTLLYWGNTITQYRHGLDLDYTRKADNPPNYVYAVLPQGWSHCTGAGGGGTGWDDPSGYPCLDGTGRGGGDLLTGLLFSSTNCPTCAVVNSTRNSCPVATNCPGTVGDSSTRQAPSPVYVWANNFTPASGFSGPALVNAAAAQIVANRDFFRQFGTNAEPGSFNGTAGVGSGTLDPTNGSAYTNAPNCSNPTYPGPGYWNTATQHLWVCTALNTWTDYYTPFTYPHPLTSGVPAPAISFSPQPLAFGNVLVNTTSATQLLTISNPGTATLTITSLNSSGAFPFQTLSGTCGGTPINISAGGSCTTGIVFTPGSVGPFNQNNTTTDNAAGSPHNIALTGTGVGGQAATPTFSVVSGNYFSPQIVSITSITSGATICYTIDGTVPTANGAGTCTHGTTLSNGATITVSFTQLVQAIASKSGGFTDSTVGIAQYTLPTSSTGVMVALVL